MDLWICFLEFNQHKLRWSLMPSDGPALHKLTMSGVHSQAPVAERILARTCCCGDAVRGHVETKKGNGRGG
jgi:hypothetical protein